MPSYTSHSIMANEVHDKLKEFGIKTSRKAMCSYSVLPDLVSLKIDNHNRYMQEYILFLVDYIKVNKLQDNENVLSLLYGVLCHYYLDTNAHPYIYSLDLPSKQPIFLSSHILIEGYINYYLSRKKLGIDILNVPKDFSISEDVSLPSKELIFKSFKSVFNTDQMPNIFRMRTLLSSLEFLHKGLIKDNELAAKLVMFNKFLDDNHYSLDSLVNEERDEWINPFTNKISNSSFIELYDKAVLDCLDAIMTVHNYLSGKIPGDILQAMFNCSYDTGEKMTMPEYKSLRKK